MGGARGWQRVSLVGIQRCRYLVTTGSQVACCCRQNDPSGPQRGYTFYEVASVNDSGSLSSNTGIDGMRGRVITDTHYHVTGYIGGVLSSDDCLFLGELALRY